VLYNQSFHMAELMVEGPDALALLTSLGVNSFATFEPGKAKQLVSCTPDGYVIGDVILFGLAEDRYNLVGRAPVLNWVTYHAETAGHDVEVQFDQRTALRTDGLRRHYRFQVQGPNAMAVLEKALGHVPEELKFFNMRTEQIAGVEVCALRHGMAGQPGWELFGPWEDYEAVHEALVSAGQDLGLTLVGGRAYGSNAIESGWIPSPLPAVYTGEGLKAYREWLPAAGYEGSASLGGSFVSPNIEDYYLTPWDLGYGHLVKFDHDFVGREALEKMADGEHRTKVTLVLNDEDVTRTIGMMFQDSDRAKFIEWPNAVYAMHQYDAVTAGGETVGVSTWICYSANEGKLLTLAILDAEHAEPGTEVTLVWGEEGGGTAKPTVEPHVQTEMRAVVAPVPIVGAVRSSYAPGGWRAAHA
jgi:syringate O-demethylase